MVFSLIMDAGVPSKRDEVALHTDLTSGAFKTNQ